MSLPRKPQLVQLFVDIDVRGLNAHDTDEVPESHDVLVCELSVRFSADVCGARKTCTYRGEHVAGVRRHPDGSITCVGRLWTPGRHVRAHPFWQIDAVDVRPDSVAVLVRRIVRAYKQDRRLYESLAHSVDTVLAAADLQLHNFYEEESRT